MWGLSCAVFGCLRDFWGDVSSIYCRATPSYAEHISSRLLIEIKWSTKHQIYNVDRRQQLMLMLSPIGVAPLPTTCHVGEAGGPCCSWCCVLRFSEPSILLFVSTPVSTILKWRNAQIINAPKCIFSKIASQWARVIAGRRPAQLKRVIVGFLVC